MIPDFEAAVKPKGANLNGDGARYWPDVRPLSSAEADEAYAKAGICTTPVRPGTKNPGSYLGCGWPAMATDDLDVIRERRQRWPDAGIAMHVGGSGLLTLDVDTPENVPEWLWALLESAVFLPTTTDPNSRRGHYVFRLRPGEMFSNGLGGLKLPNGKKWGEVKCYGGGLVLAPTVHPRADEGGQYQGVASQPIPYRPNEIADKLNAAPDADEHKILTPSEVDAKASVFLSEYVDDREPYALDPICRSFDSTPSNRHPSLWDALCWAMREAKAGCFPAARARDALRYLWTEAIGGEYRDGDADEFNRLLRDAIVVADNDGTVEELRARKDNFRDVEMRRLAHNAIDAGLPVHDLNYVDEEAFWNSRVVLRDLRQFARARRVGPWAMFGCVLTLAIATVPPNVVLPPLVGHHASLNTFAAIVGKSGANKSAAMAAAKAWLGLEPEPEIKKPGSGEGLAKCFAYMRKATKTAPAEQVGKTWTVLALLPEVDTLTSTAGRGGSTIMSELRYAWSGERLGLDYANDDKVIVLRDNRYRLCMTVGVQELRAQPVFDDKDAGTPQRFIWLPARDTERILERPLEPAKLDLPAWPTNEADEDRMGVDPNILRANQMHLPADEAKFEVLELPPEALKMIDDAAVARSGPENPDAEPLDGHSLLCREKVAAGLMRLDCRTDEITSEDWELAGIVMQISDQTRAKALAALAVEASKRNRAVGRASGVRKLAEAEVVSLDRMKTIVRVADNMVRHIKEAGGEIARITLRNDKIAYRDREYFDDAETSLIDDARITKEPITVNGQDGHVLRIVKGV